MGRVGWGSGSLPHKFVCFAEERSIEFGERKSPLIVQGPKFSLIKETKTRQLLQKRYSIMCIYL